MTRGVVNFYEYFPPIDRLDHIIAERYSKIAHTGRGHMVRYISHQGEVNRWETVFTGYESSSTIDTSVTVSRHQLSVTSAGLKNQTLELTNDA